MVAYSRKRKAATKPTRSPIKKNRFTGRKIPTITIQRAVKAAMNRNVETKRSNFTSTDGIQITHNNFQELDTNLLSTTQGVQDPNSNDVSNRIGDEIMLKGVSIKLMLEMNERYSDVTFRIMVIKCAKGDVPTRATLFTGLSGNKMLDTIVHERYTVLAQKWVQLKAPGITGVGGAPVAGEGNNLANDASVVSSRATKIVKMWLPGAKFGKGGKILYENGSSQVKFFDYRLVVYCYSNFSTLQDVWNVGRVNDYVKQMYYKDA